MEDVINNKFEKAIWKHTGQEMLVPIDDNKLTFIRLEVCSKCGFEKTEYNRWYNYCPVCGRRMFKTLEEANAKKEEVVE